MKIGFDAKRVFNNKTGLGNYSRTLLEGLVAGFPSNEYHLYTPTIKLENEFLQTQNNVYRHFPVEVIHKNLSSLWRSNYLVGDLLRDNIDVFHGLSNEIPRGIEQSGIKSVVTIHDLIFLHYPKLYPWFDRKLYQRKFASAVERADRVIAASQQTKQDILKYYHCSPEKVKVIYQSCHPGFGHARTLEQKEKVKTKFGLNRNFILSVGTLEHRKNHLNLLKAFVQSGLNDYDLCLVGKKADAYPDLLAFVHQHKLERRVHFFHEINLEDLQTLYQLARVGAYISNYEGFGIPVLEAFKSNLPMLCSNKSSLPELAGEAALLVEPDQLKRIAEGLSELALNEALRDKLRIEMKHQLQHFNPEVLTAQLMEVYSELIN